MFFLKIRPRKITHWLILDCYEHVSAEVGEIPTDELLEIVKADLEDLNVSETPKKVKMEKKLEPANTKINLQSIRQVYEQYLQKFLEQTVTDELKIFLGVKGS